MKFTGDFGRAMQETHDDPRWSNDNWLLRKNEHGHYELLVGQIVVGYYRDVGELAFAFLRLAEQSASLTLALEFAQKQLKDVSA